MIDYDIFLSYKNEDYESAKQIYDFLSSHNYNVFFAEPELRRNSDSMYGKIIDEALESSEHFILFASQKEYVTSSYVEQEWRLFVEEKRSERKSGNIITILDGVEVSALPIALRYFQSFQLSNYDNILDFLPKKPKSAELEKFIQELNNILSDETLTEKVYADFKEEYSTTCSNDLIPQIKITIEGIINDVETNRRQLKQSEFVTLIKDLVKDYISKKETDIRDLARDIIMKHCEAASASVGGILFKLYASVNVIELKTEKFNISSNIDLMYSSMNLFNGQTGFGSFLPQNLLGKIQELMLTPVAKVLLPLLFVHFMPFLILDIIQRQDRNISPSELKKTCKRYDTDTRKIKAGFEKMIDANEQIKLQIHEVIKSFCHNCKSTLLKMGVAL